MELFSFIFTYFILIFTIIICLSYLLLGLISAYQLLHYKRANSAVNYDILLSDPNAPSISILAPAYNESKTIVDNVNALLSIHYNNFEVIVINDGSTDDSLSKLIQEYELKSIDFAVNSIIPTKEIRAVYRSKNRAFRLLTVVDKYNGGKADSLNAGLNIAQHDLFVAIDVDSVIEPDALLKMAKPFMENSDEQVIATGGAIRIANSCHIENGHIVQVEVPKNLWARFQVVEYTRAFLMGRIAWSKLNGLLLISGALGLFDKQVAMACGGYNHNTVGEDMELVIRMRKYMYNKKIKHRVEYIPDPLCWTEVPDNLTMLHRQRNRWTRGLMDSLHIHRKMFFNPTYGSLGMLGYPFWFFFEWLAPIIEVLGLSYMVYLIIIGAVNWPFFLFLFLFVYLFAVAFSSYAILYEEYTFHKYRKVTDIIKLIAIAFIEPFSYHFINVYNAIRGNISFLLGNKTWGVQERKGFKSVPETKK